MRTKTEIKQTLKKAAEAEAGRIIYPDKTYWTKGELLLDNSDQYIVELFSYDNLQELPPMREHFRETFDTKDKALEYVKQLNEGDFPRVYRQISLYDMTAERPHYRIMWQVGY